ncbi:hypothetical protein HBI79_015320 [Parastagonospora nodorum]|nr:hypothetical protein HBI79_015320 [Parastagonospora nodorum]
MASKDTLLNSILAHFEPKLRDLASQQDQLMNMRESLLVQREDALADKKAVREQRIRTVNAEVALMNAFRKHYKQLDRPLPKTLMDAYEAAEKQQQELRSWEESLLEAEEDLGASEWTFADLETEFYQYKITQLFSDDINTEDIKNLIKGGGSLKPDQDLDFQPSIQAQYQTIEFKHNQLSKRFEALRKQQALRLDTFTQSGDMSLVLAENNQMKLEAEALSNGLLGMIADYDIQLQQLRPGLRLGPNAPFKKLHLVSEPNGDRSHHDDDVKTAYTSRSEGALPSTVNDVSVDERMADWSLQSLKMSALDKLRYLNILRSKLEVQRPTVLDFDLLEPLITNLWRTEDVDQSARHLSDVLVNTPRIKGSSDADTEEAKPSFEPGTPTHYSLPQSEDTVTHGDNNTQHGQLSDLPNFPSVSTHAPGTTMSAIVKVCRSGSKASVGQKPQNLVSRNAYTGSSFENIISIDSISLKQESSSLIRHVVNDETLQKIAPDSISPTIAQGENSKLDVRIGPWPLNEKMAVMTFGLKTVDFLLWVDSIGVTNTLGLGKGTSCPQATDTDGRYPLKAFLQALIGNYVLCLHLPPLGLQRPQFSSIARALYDAFLTSGDLSLMSSTDCVLYISVLSRDSGVWSSAPVLPGYSAVRKPRFHAELSQSGSICLYIKPWKDQKILPMYNGRTRLQIMNDGQLIMGSEMGMCSMCVPS